MYELSSLGNTYTEQKETLALGGILQDVILGAGYIQNICENLSLSCFSHG